VLQPGSRIAGYLVEGEIGTGSTSVVYRVRRPDRPGRFALKVLSHRHPEVFQRMRREAELMAALDHPNIVRFVEVLDLDRRLGLVMEWVPGPSLERWLERHPEAPTEVRDAIAEQIVRGVAHAHRAGLIHRDLKPANVLLESRGRDVPVPRITDFGLAKVVGDRDGVSYTRTGYALGTPRYMAPEQIRSAKHVDARADVFSLGCLLYELYCRRVAFPQPDMLSVFNAVCTGDFVDPHTLPAVPPDVATAIRESLAVDREERPADAQVLLERIWSAADARTRLFHRPTPPPAPRSGRPPAPGWPAWWTGAAAMGFGGVIGATFAGALLTSAVLAMWWLSPTP